MASVAHASSAPLVQRQEVCVRATSFAQRLGRNLLLHLVTTQNSNSCHPLPELNNNAQPSTLPDTCDGTAFRKLFCFFLSAKATWTRAT